MSRTVGWDADPYDRVVFVQGHRHSEPICAWPDCETYLTREQMVMLPDVSGEYVITALTDAYEVGIKDGMIVAACRCGQGAEAPNKGLGRAFIATWKTRHQEC